MSLDVLKGLGAGSHQRPTLKNDFWALKKKFHCPENECAYPSFECVHAHLIHVYAYFNS